MPSFDASAPALLEPGVVIGDRYRIVGPLGAGGMGTVYKVHHTLMAKDLAMKLLRPELSGVPSVQERFEREARSASRLDDPHIVRVTDFGRAADGSLFLVMELLEGESLAARVARGPLPVEEALRVLDQILAALEHAHAQGVVHRDLKPDNVMLVPREGRTAVKLLDFGLAKLSGAEAGGPPVTQAGMVFGTPRYMAPEQAAAEPMDQRTDLYAVGVLGFELLSGRPPFEGAGAVDVLTRHLTQPPPPLVLPGVEPALVARLDAVLRRALAKPKEDRFATAADLRAAFAGCRASAEGAPPLPTPPAREAIAGRAAPSPRGLGARLAPLGWLGAALPRRRRSQLALAAMALALALAVYVLGRGAPAMDGFATAERALAAGELPAARAVLAQLSAKLPDDARVQLLEGHLGVAEGELEAAANAYKRALERDGAVAGDPVLAVNAKRLVDKSPKAGAQLVTALALHADASGAALLAELAQSAPGQRARSHAFQALERLGETSRLDLYGYLTGELERVRAESCKTRKWYIDRLAALGDARALPVLKRERARKGGLFNLEDVNGCMAEDLAAHIAKLEQKH